MGYGSRYSNGYQSPSLDEHCVYLASFSRLVMEEEMGTLARYTQCASAALALGASSQWEVFWPDWHDAKMKLMEKNIYDLKLQRDIYLHGAKETSMSLLR